MQDMPLWLNWLNWLVIFLAVIVTMLFAYFGGFSNRWFRSGVDRSIGLNIGDLFIVIGVVLVGMIMFSLTVSCALKLNSEIGGINELNSQLQVALVITGQLMWQLPAALYFFWKGLSREGGLRRVGIRTSHLFKDILVGIIGWLCAVPVILTVLGATGILGSLFKSPPPVFGHELLLILLDSDALLTRGMLLFSAVCLAPVLEEFLFRGFLQTAILDLIGCRWRWVAILTAGFVFVLIHVDAVTWHGLPGLFVLAVVLGWLYEKTGSLWVPVISHACFNLSNICFALLLSDIPVP